MPDTVWPCSSLQNRVEALTKRERTLQAALRTASPAEKPDLIAEILNVQEELESLRGPLAECILNNPRPLKRLPDLAPDGLRAFSLPNSDTVDFRAAIKNIGAAPVRGPFKIVLGCTIERPGSTLTSQITITVPDFVVIYPPFVVGPTENQQARLSRDRNASRFGSLFPTTYVTDTALTMPLYTRFLHNAEYLVEYIIDSDEELAEESESNNYFAGRYRF